MSEEKFTYIEHPIEDILELESGSTMVPVTERQGTELTIDEEYDNKDKEIESQFHEIYESAMTAFERQENDNQRIEPKYRARNQEVAVQYLNTALSAAKEKRSLKEHKDKSAVKRTQGPNTVNNNLVVADRNEILKSLAQQSVNEDET